MTSHSQHVSVPFSLLARWKNVDFQSTASKIPLKVNYDDDNFEYHIFSEIQPLEKAWDTESTSSASDDDNGIRACPRCFVARRT